MKTIRMRIIRQGDMTTVKALIRHPMETGRRVDAEGNILATHFIREIACQHNGVNVLTAHWGPGVSKNPFLSFNLRGAEPGDEITLRWSDNLGASDSAVAKVP